MIRKIHTDKAPVAIGPYVQAVATEDFLFTSGQIPVKPETGEVAGDTVEEQAEQVMRNVEAVLEAAGMGTGNVLKTTCFLADMKDFGAFNEVYGRHFTSCPARSCVAVKELPKGVLCEMEVIAHK